jgi:LysM domain
MSRSSPRLLPLLCALGLCAGVASGPASATNYPVTDGQRSTAQKVAQAGVPLSELAPNAPDSHTVKRGDTLWAISKIFLKSPWRWPELWGMNLEQIRNPHLIYPGQVLWLDKSSGRAVLRVGRPVESGDAKLSPRIRPESLQDSAIGSVPMSVIGPFLTESVVLEANDLIEAPRIVATQEGRVLLSRGETAYVRGDVSKARTWQLYREPQPLTDPLTNEVLGFEARHVGVVEQVRAGESRPSADGKTTELVPATFTVVSLREEANIGDRLAPQPPRDFEPYAPHAPAGTLAARIVAVHGDGLNAGQNQIVSINRGAKDGMERGHVLALWRAGQTAVDTTTGDRAVMRLPDTRVGELFVFRVFDRVSYALVLQANTAVTRGDLVTQP